MITAIRGYANAPMNTADISVLTQTDTVTAVSEIGGATGSEFANSRLGNFLSDDAAPRDRDLDTLMSSEPLGLYDKGPQAPDSQAEARSEAPPPPPPPEDVDPIALPPMESLVNSQMQQAAEIQQDLVFTGISSGSFAQEMYTNTQDVLSRIAA
ncbi:hypothetical protein TRIHO_27050 [Tritonibacter horizontis]|uniref:Uncharacterized protein n=2 Tax=Tritonibacter horizontis TaxID=1768241 RepID=A0A132BVJ7_9RHOB|nr:hypothetical protein TRIHO_27050 [Tritonibacter horizontis]